MIVKLMLKYPKIINDVRGSGALNGILINAESKFIGKNFVFDYRLGERITDDVISGCHQCKGPSDNHTNCVNQACHILFIQCNKCSKEYNNCCSKECSDFIA